MGDYDADILLWAEYQAALLRRRAAGELVNEAEMDWSNIAEEIEDVGATGCMRSNRFSSRLCATCSRPKLGRCPAPRPAGELTRSISVGKRGGVSCLQCGTGSM